MREGVSSTQPTGSSWQSIGDMLGFVSVHLTAGRVWGVGEGRQLALRCGFTERFPLVTRGRRGEKRKC